MYNPITIDELKKILIPDIRLWIDKFIDEDKWECVGYEDGYFVFQIKSEFYRYKIQFNSYNLDYEEIQFIYESALGKMTLSYHIRMFDKQSNLDIVWRRLREMALFQSPILNRYFFEQKEDKK